MLVNDVFVGGGRGVGSEGDPITGRENLKITLRL